MYNADPPPPSALPSARALVRSTLVALAVAALLLVGVVFPAEYGVDPTGVGRVLGLTEMGRIKVALAREAEAEDAAAGSPAVVAATPAPAAQPADSAAATDTPPAERVTRITLQPDEGKEVKLVMRKDARAEFAWTAEGGGVNYDMHGSTPADPARGLPRIGYHGYGKGSGVPSDEGVLVAAFDGSHGWFWRNRTRAPVTVTLRTTGDYERVVGPD